MTGGGGTNTGRRGTMVGCAPGFLAAVAAAGLAGAGFGAAGLTNVDLAADGLAAAGLAAGLFVAAVLGGLVWVWARACAASIVTAPSRTTGTICFIAIP